MLPSVEGFAQWILSMARAEPSRRAKDKAELVEQIMEVFEANKSRYGSPREQAVASTGLKCGHNRIGRLMRENGLAACAMKVFRPRTTLPGGGVCLI
jgi:transposase InsO family protein